MQQPSWLISLPHQLVQAILLGGLLVAVWEFEAVAVRRSAPRWSLVAQAFGAPVALLLATLWSGITVPYGVFAAALISVWFMIPATAWQWLGGGAVLVSAIVQSLLEFGWSVRTLLGAAFLVGMVSILQVVIKTATSWHRHFVVGLYAAAVVGAMVFMAVNRDPVRDLVVSLGVAILLAVYIVGRSDRERRSQRDVYRAEHDALTDALTRHGLATWFADSVPRAGQTGVVVACDVDDFKWFNDTWGHDIGDEVLRQFARRLRTELRDKDALVRPGGDEFVVWIPEASAATGDEIAQRLHRAVTERVYRLRTGCIHLGVSIGWAAGPLTEETARIADRRLLLAKRQGKNRVYREGDSALS